MNLSTRSACAVLVTVLGLGLAAAPAAAIGLRAPQVAFNGASLQGYFATRGQALNVYADQWDIQCWSTTISGNSTFTIMLELSGAANANSVGLYNCGVPNPQLFLVFPGIAGPGWFAVASFDVGVPGRLVVTLFDNNAIFMGQTIYVGVNSGNFGFYLQGPGGLFYSEDARNGGSPQMLAYPGTGTSVGQWWLCFEDTPFVAGNPAGDFDDFVLFMESVNPPVPTLHTTWGDIKASYGTR